MSEMSFDAVFRAAFGKAGEADFRPFGYQCRLACGDGANPDDDSTLLRGTELPDYQPWATPKEATRTHRRSAEGAILRVLIYVGLKIEDRRAVVEEAREVSVLPFERE